MSIPSSFPQDTGPRPPVPLYDFMKTADAQMAMAPGEDNAEVSEHIGLIFDEKSGLYLHPRLQDLLTQKISVKDLDDEELIRGQVRNADGRFSSNRAKAKIPRQFHDELMRRILELGAETLRKNYLLGVDTIIELMTDSSGVANGGPSPELRAKLAIWLTERMAGKTPDKVELAVAVKP